MKLRFYRVLSLVLAGILIIVPLLSPVSYAMTEDELPEGELILSEVNLEQAILKPGSENYGSMEIVDVEGEAFSKALRFTTNVQPSYTYDFQYEIPLEAAIEKDDVMLASFYARTISSTHETSEGTVAFVMEKLETWDKSITEQVAIPPEWKKYYIPIVAALDMGENQSQVALRVGFKPQVIEIADIKVVNFKKAVTIDELPTTPVYYEGMEENAPWREAANERIEKYRKGDLEVIVLDEQGAPVEGADVHVKMTKHDFKFGTAVNSAMLFGTDENSEMYRQKLKENFNSVVMENELKWQWWEGDKARTVNLYNWLGENGFSIRGHTLLWDGLTRMPEDIRDIYNDPELIQKRIEDHYHEVGGYFKGRLIDWDVLNEPTANYVIRSVYGDEIAADWFKLAKEADPYAKLYVNETQIIGIDGPVIGQFSDFVEILLENGAPVDGIGIQGHFGSTPVAPMAFYAQLDHFAQYVDEIAITEFDMNSPREEIQGQFSRDILIASFSHPKMESFTMWGFWDGAHWQSNAPLFRNDWTLKPSGEEWRRLIYDVWWTDVLGVTDASGTYQTRGFYGEYDVTVAYEGTEQTYQTSLLKNRDNKLVIVLGQEQSKETDDKFIPLPVPGQNDEITAPVWRFGSAFEAVNVSPTSVTLKWPHAHDNDEVDYYSIYQDGSRLGQVPANVTSYDVTGLEQDKTYSFTVVAVDKFNNYSAESSPIVVTTSEAIDSTMPGWNEGSFITVTELAATSATISWPEGVDNVGPEAYRIYVNDQFIDETEEQSYRLEHLTENSVYTVRVEVKDEDGNISIGGPIVTFKTLGTEDKIAPAWSDPSLIATEVDASSVSLQWSTATDNRAVTAYRVFKDNEELITLSASLTSYMVQGLSDHTSYSFRIEAGDAANNWSSTGPEFTVKTAVAYDAEAPVWPSDRLLTYSGLTDREVTLNWTAAQDNIGVTSYRVFMDNTEIAHVDGETQSYVVQNLDADQSYTFRIEAQDGFSNLSTTGPSLAINTLQGLVRQEVKIAPSDDAFPQSPALGNFGGDGFNNNTNMLRYKNAAGASGSEEMKNTGNNRRIYMKFPLDTVTGNVYEAKLNVYVFAVQSPNMDIGMDLYVTGDDWTESTINWKNKPEAGEHLASETIRNAGYWKSFEVTDYVISEVNGDKEISFLLQDDMWLDQNVDIHSKEASNVELRPYLSVGSETIEVDVNSPAWVDGSLATTEVKPNQVTLAWDGATDNIGIQSYSIYQDDTLIATVGADVNSYIVTGLSPSTTYTFKVEAADTMQESTDGPQLSVSTEAADEEEPTWPAEASLTAHDVTRFTAALQWTAAEDQYGIDKYVIYAEEQAVGEVAGNKRTLTVTNLLAGTSYEFTVSAVDAAGNEAMGPAVTVTTLPADTESPVWTEGSALAPIVVEAYGIHLQWPSAVDDTAVVSYEIYQGDVKLAEVGKYINQYYVQGLQPNTSYTFTVYAFDAAGNQSLALSLADVNSLELDTIHPIWPTGSRITAELSGEDVRLQWNHALDNIGIKQYVIYRNGVFIDQVSSEVTSYTIVNSNDLTAVYKVEAEDFSGNVSKSGPRTGDPIIPIPTDITPPTWPLNSEIIATEITESSVELSWPEATDKLGIAEYQLIVNGTLASRTAHTTLVLENLSTGSTYLIKVEAVDLAGNITADGPSITVTTQAKDDSDTGTVTPPATDTGSSGQSNVNEVSIVNGKATIKINQLTTSNNQTKAIVDEQILADAFAKTKQDDRSARTVKIELPKQQNVSSYLIEVPASYVTNNGNDNEIEIVTALGSLILAGNMLANNKLAAEQSMITIRISQSQLAEHVNVNGKVGLVLELEVEANGQRLTYNNIQSSVIVTIPYQLNEQESGEFVSVWYIDEQGNVKLVPTSAYHKATGTVTFKTHHFSQFSVSYFTKTFTDLSSVPWAQQAIEVLASKGIINGVSEHLYQPKSNVTRADFTKLLMETLGITAEIQSSFKDIKESDYYYEAVGMAHTLGIVQGSGDELFHPKSLITRQDMMVIIARALNYMNAGLVDSQEEALANYSDRDQISAYAVDAVASLVNEELVQGNNNKLEPLSNSTRAEAAMIMYRLYHYVFQ